MKALAKRATGMALLCLLVLVPGLWALGDCADYISSGGGEEPLTGQLIGQRTVSVTTSSSFTGSANKSILGGGFSYQRTRTITYTVGIYRMSDGSTKEIRCDTYQYA